MKKTGKVLSLVLSLALVASSLTATFASAATTAQGGGSVAATTTADSKVIEFKSGSGVAEDGNPFTLPTTGDVTYTDANGYTYTGAATLAPSDWSTSGTGATLLNTGAVKATGEGTTTFTATKTVTVTKGTTTASVSAQFKVTVRVLDNSKKYLVAVDHTGTGVTLFPTSVPINSKAKIAVMALKAATANSTVVDLSAVATGADASTANVWLNTTTIAYSSSNTNVRGLSEPASGATTLTVPTTPIVGSTTITAKDTGWSVTGVLTVNKAYDMGSTATTVYAPFNSTVATICDGANTYNVSGFEIDGSGALVVTGGSVDTIASTGTVTIKGGSVNKISEGTDAIVVDGGTVTTIHSNSIAATVTVNGGTVATIKGYEVAGNASAAGAITVNKGTVNTIDSQGGVNVNGGVVGAIAGNAVAVTASALDVPTTVNGNITAATATIGDTAQNADVKVAGKVAVTGATLAINGNTSYATKVGSIMGKAADTNGAYTTALSFNGFQGSIPSAPQFTGITVSGSSEVTIGAKVTVASLTVDSSSKVILPDAYVGTLVGAGKITVPAGKLVVSSAISNSPVIAFTSGAKVGDLAYKSISGAATAFSTDAYTFEEKSLGNNVYGYYVKTMKLVGLNLPTTAKVAKGYTTTLAASLDPVSATLPAGATVKWTVPDDSYATVTGNGLTATVKGVDWSDINLGGANDVVVTATIVDKDGNQLTDYATASCTVTVTEKPETATYTSDTTGTYNMKVGQSYTFKITSSDGSVPPFVVASNGATVAPYTKSGNAYYFKVTGAKVGDYGVYVGDRVCILHITSDVTCDTKTVTIANGKTYQFKVTAPKAPAFVVAGVGTVKPVKVEGNNYFYKVMNDGAAGQYGVYINGARMAVITCTK